MPARRATVWVTVKRAENLVSSSAKGNNPGGLKHAAFVEVCLVKEGKELKRIAEVGKGVKNVTNNPVWDHSCSPEEVEVGDTLQFKVSEEGKWPRKEVVIGSATLRLTQEMVERKLKDECLELTKVGSDPFERGMIQVSFRFESDAVPPPSIQRPVVSAPAPAPPITTAPVPSPITPTSLAKDPLPARVDMVTYIYWERGLRTRKQPILCTAGVVAYLRSCCFNCFSRTNNDSSAQTLANGEGSGEGKEQPTMADKEDRNGKKNPFAAKTLPAINSKGLLEGA